MLAMKNSVEHLGFLRFSPVFLGPCNCTHTRAHTHTHTLLTKHVKWYRKIERKNENMYKGF